MVDLFSYDIVLIPIHLGMHWSLAVVDFINKQLRYYDSLGGQNHSCLTRVRRYLVSEAAAKDKQQTDVSKWMDCTLTDIPQQHNGSDCGPFTCMYARFIASESPFTFTQQDMPTIRSHIICELLEGELLTYTNEWHK